MLVAAFAGAGDPGEQEHPGDEQQRPQDRGQEQREQ
jgi:hypothetical protein